MDIIESKIKFAIECIEFIKEIEAYKRIELYNKEKIRKNKLDEIVYIIMWVKIWEMVEYIRIGE